MMKTDKEKLITTLQYRINETRNKGRKVTTIFTKTLSNCMDLIKKQEEIVRCNDCKYYVKSQFTSGMFCGNTGMDTDPDWFCADGERKE